MTDATPIELVVHPGAVAGGMTVTLMPHPDDRAKFDAELAAAGRVADLGLAAGS